MDDLEELRKIAEANDKVLQLTRTIQAETDAVLKNVAALKAQGATQDAVNAAMAAGKARIDAQVAALNQVQTQLAAGNAKLATAANAAASATAALADGGIKGLASAVPGLASAFMGPVGLVAAITAVGAAIEFLSPHVSKLIESLDAERVGPFISSLEKGINRLEELKKQATLTAEDTFERQYTERGVRSRESARKAGEAMEGEVPHPGPALGRAVSETIAGSASWEAVKDRTLTHLAGTMGDQAADKIQAELEDEMRRANEGVAGPGRKPMGMDPVLKKEYAKRIIEERKKARLAGQSQAGEDFATMVSRAKAGDPDAIAKLAKAMRDAGEEGMAARLEDALGRARLKAAGPMGPADEMKEVRDDAERNAIDEYDAETSRFEHGNQMWRDRQDWKKYKQHLAEQQYDAETSQFEHGNDLWRMKRAERAEKDRKRMARFERMGPQWDDQDRQERFLMESMARGVDETETRAMTSGARRAADNAGLRFGNRWSATGRFAVETRRVHRAVSLEEASKQLEEQRYEALVAQGVDRSTAREEAKRYGERAYGSQMQRGYDAWKSLQEMQMTGQIGRGVQVMGSEQYIDSVQTAREGVDKQLLELTKKLVEADAWKKEWLRVNGVVARVGKRKGP